MSAVPPPIPTRQPQSPVPPVPPQSQNLEFKANFVDGLISYGGKIIITPTQLIFHAHKFNFGDLHDKVFEIRDICGYKKGMLTFLDIKFRYGLTIKLAVWAKQQIIDALEARRKALS